MSKHTEGEVTYVPRTLNRTDYDFEIITGSNNPRSRFIGLIGSGMSMSKEENQANAELFVEAFNTANETGKTPRQLQQQNKDLSELLTGLLENYHFVPKTTYTGTDYLLIAQTVVKTIDP